MVKGKVQKDKQRSINYIHRSEDRVPRTPQNFGVNSDAPDHEGGKIREVFATSGTYPWSFVTQIFHNGQPSHGGDRKTFEMMTTT